MSFFAKYSDYCTRFFVCAVAFLHIYQAFSFYLCNCLPFVRVYCADDVYVLIFTLCRSRFCIRSGVYSCNILLLSTCRRFQDFDALLVGRKRALYVCFFVSELCRVCYARFSVITVKYRLKPHCLVCFTSNKLSTYQQSVFSGFRFENDFVDFFTVKRLTS